MVKLKITADSPALQDLAKAIASLKVTGLLPATETAFSFSAKKLAEHWRAYAAGKEEISGVPPMKKPSRNYMMGVNVKKNSPTEYTISNTSANAARLEYGTKAFDMKRTHPYGRRSRISDDGTPYLIVPFSWGNPKSVTFQNRMSEDIYQIVAKMKKSTVKKETTFEQNYRGEPIERHTYNWGGSLDSDAENASGMVRMHDAPTGGSSYFTFRIISAKSPKNSWRNPGIKARNVTQGLMKQYRQKIVENIQEGLKADLS